MNATLKSILVAISNEADPGDDGARSPRAELAYKIFLALEYDGDPIAERAMDWLSRKADQISIDEASR
jgi:hypothetical protein